MEYSKDYKEATVNGKYISLERIRACYFRLLAKARSLLLELGVTPEMLKDTSNCWSVIQNNDTTPGSSSIKNNGQLLAKAILENPNNSEPSWKEKKNYLFLFCFMFFFSTENKKSKISGDAYQEGTWNPTFKSDWIRKCDQLTGILTTMIHISNSPGRGSEYAGILIENFHRKRSIYRSEGNRC